MSVYDFHLKRGDTSPSFERQLTGDGAPIDLSEAGTTVRFIMHDGGEAVIDRSASIVDAPEGVVRYNWLDGDTDTVGTYRAEFEVTYSDGAVESFPNDHDLYIRVAPDLG